MSDRGHGTQGTSPRIPLVIGITGHRDLRPQDIPALEQKVQHIFNDLHSQYPRTPLVLLTQLAEGSDRLAARVALKSDISITGVLPMPREIYATDFVTPESQNEFSQLLEKLNLLLVMPASDSEVSGQARDHLYEKAGAYIVRHCQILMSLWDGVDTGKQGGTSEMVRFKLEGLPESYRAVPTLDPEETGPVYHVVTPRSSNPKVDHAFELISRYPAGSRSEKGSEEAHFRRIFARINEYNQDIDKFQDSLRARRKESRAAILSADKLAALPKSFDRLIEFLACSDSMAIHFQKLSRWWATILLALSFSAAVLYDTYVHVFEDSPVHFWLYAGSFVIALLVYMAGKFRDLENKYLDYRALAEGLRVQFFWQLASIPDSAADHYLYKQRSELDWIRYAVRNASFAAPHSVSLPYEERLQLVLDRWIGDQLSYYSKNAHHNQNLFPPLKYASVGLLYFAGLLSLVKVCLESYGQMDWLENQITLDHFLLIFGLSAVVGAILHTYAEKRAFSEHAKQYSRMAAFFESADRSLRKKMGSPNSTGAREVIELLGKEALAENGDWVILHRERHVELPKLKG